MLFMTPSNGLYVGDLLNTQGSDGYARRCALKSSAGLGGVAEQLTCRDGYKRYMLSQGVFTGFTCFLGLCQAGPQVLTKGQHRRFGCRDDKR